MKGGQDEFYMCEAADSFLLIVSFSPFGFSLIHFFFFNNENKRIKKSRLEKYVVCNLVRSSPGSNAEGLVPLRDQRDSFSSLTAGGKKKDENF